MKIGLDLSSLQSAHRMRGIGYTLINLINNLPAELKHKHSFVFYLYTDKGSDSPLDILDLEGITYETRALHPARRINKTLPGKFNLLIRLLNQVVSISDTYFGDSRIRDIGGIDIFLQTDQSISLPKGGSKKAFIAYDVIPYVLEWDYLWNYETARLHGLPRQASIRCSARRWAYIHKLRVNTRRANKVISISDVTREDFLRYTGAPEDKIVTVPLGVNSPKRFSVHEPLKMHRYIASSWGYLRRPFSFDNVPPFLLFVGGADKRRRLEDVVTAFNHLRGQGYDVKLVLAGDSMQGPTNISTEVIQKALLESSYIDDIIFMGFVDDRQRDWLYSHALAFVFPSKYEGFGLPVLEAFSYGCPVVAYPNQATVEVARDVPIYANNYRELAQSVAELLDQSPAASKELKERSIQQAEGFKWAKTASDVISLIES
jgi:glycosyltransferase involved in cell wall biosynthesis